jgi:hypothetical protein
MKKGALAASVASHYPDPDITTNLRFASPRVLEHKFKICLAKILFDRRQPRLFVCAHCRQIHLVSAFAQAWKEDYVSVHWRTLHSKLGPPRIFVPSQEILLSSVSSILAEKHCSLCFSVAAALKSLPGDLEANVKELPSSHARLRVEQYMYGRPESRSRFHDQNYIKLNRDFQSIHDRFTELRASRPW